MISLVRPTGRPAFNSVRHPWIGCRSQHRGMGSRPLRKKVRWGCPPWLLSPPPHRTQSWRPCLPGQPWASGWRSTECPVPSHCGWMIGFSEWGAAHNHALLQCLSSWRCMRSWQSRGWPLSRPEAARPPPPSSLPSTAGLPGGTRAFPRWRERSRCTCAHETLPLGGTVRISRPKHAMAILQVHQAKALKQVQEHSTDPGLMQELRTAANFALRATKVTARSLGKAISTMVVQERNLWLTLAEMKDVDKAHFLDAPISQVGLFGDTVEGFAQQFSAVQQQTEANPGGESSVSFCLYSTVGPRSLTLHHHRYVDCAVGAACTASGGVAHATQPVSLAHAHNSTWLYDSVRQATSQVQWCSRDVLKTPCLARGDCCPPGKGCN